MIQLYFTSGSRTTLLQTHLPVLQVSEGLAHLPLHRGAFLIASNHTSHLDASAVMVGAYLAGAHKVYAIGARDYFFRNALKRWFVTSCMNVVPISRSKFTQKEADALKDVVRQGSSERPVAVSKERLHVLAYTLLHVPSDITTLAKNLLLVVNQLCVGFPPADHHLSGGHALGDRQPAAVQIRRGLSSGSPPSAGCARQRVGNPGVTAQRAHRAVAETGI